jgi:hypothetical protein
MDRLGAWVESYQQARVHQVGSSYIPDVCVTAHLKVDYSDPCDHSSTDALKVMSDAAAQQAASIEVAAEQVPAPGPPTTPPKPIGVRGPFHPAHPPTEAELAEQARKGLNSYKAGQADGIDMARFMVDAETRASVKTLSAEDYEKIRRLWATKEEAYRELVKATPGDKEVKTRRLMKAINKDFTSNYCRDQARISSFLGNDRCGNCVAETILEIAALRATDLMPDPPSRLTVQAFGDHAQAIIYTPASDGKPQRLWNLLTGEVTTTVIAPLYDQEILIAGYVNSHGGKSPIQNKDLLVAEIDPGVMIQTGSRWATSHRWDTRSSGLSLPPSQRGRSQNSRILLLPKIQTNHRRLVRSTGRKWTWQPEKLLLPA